MSLLSQPHHQFLRKQRLSLDGLRTGFERMPTFAPCTILAEIITKQFLRTIIFVAIFVIITKIIPPEYFFVMLLALVCPCLQGNMRRNLLRKEIVL